MGQNNFYGYAHPQLNSSTQTNSNFNYKLSILLQSQISSSQASIYKYHSVSLPHISKSFTYKAILSVINQKKSSYSFRTKQDKGNDSSSVLLKALDDNSMKESSLKPPKIQF